MFLDAEGRKIMLSGRSQGEFEKGRDEATAFLELLAQAAEGDEKARLEAFMMKLDLGWLGLDEARAEMETFDKLSKKQRAAIETKLVETEVRELAKGAGRDLAKRRAAGARCAELYDEGFEPENVERLIEFWSLLADHAEATDDSKLMKKVVKAADKSVKKHPRGRELVRALEQRLKNM